MVSSTIICSELVDRYEDYFTGGMGAEAIQTLIRNFDLEAEAEELRTIIAEGKGQKKVRTGYVVSDKMAKTIVVELEDRKQHALYGKIMRRNSRVKAHDEEGLAGVGDRVRIEETRPLSKDKHFRLLDIVEKAR